MARPARPLSDGGAAASKLVAAVAAIAFLYWSAHREHPGGSGRHARDASRRRARSRASRRRADAAARRTRAVGDPVHRPAATPAVVGVGAARVDGARRGRHDLRAAAHPARTGHGRPPPQGRDVLVALALRGASLVERA